MASPHLGLVCSVTWHHHDDQYTCHDISHCITSTWRNLVHAASACNAVQEWTGEQCIGDAMLELAVRLPRARMIITTRGAEGSVCLLRQEHGSQQVRSGGQLEALLLPGWCAQMRVQPLLMHYCNMTMLVTLSYTAKETIKMHSCAPSSSAGSGEPRPRFPDAPSGLPLHARHCSRIFRPVVAHSARRAHLRAQT